MDFTKGKWKVYKVPAAYLINTDNMENIADCKTEANAHLIAAAVNACQSVNQDNPMAVATSIKDMYEALKRVASIEQTTGKVCSLCGGYLDHKGDCLFILAKQTKAKAEGRVK